VAHAETLGCIADRGRGTVGRSRDLQEELMLLRLQAELLRCVLAELEEQAELMTELGEGSELGQGCGGCSVGSDGLIIS
jgi:hypothetical protein